MGDKAIIGELVNQRTLWDVIWEYLKQIFLYHEKAPLIFTSYYFWGFFALVMLVYSFIHKKYALRSAFLFAASLFFYWKSSGFFFLILIFSTLSDYLIGLIIHNSKDKVLRMFLLVLSIVVNLSMLCYFKYAYFFTDTFNLVFETKFEVMNHFAWLFNETTHTNYFTVSKILLPVGISFFTFQTISYTVDVYKGKIKPLTNILDFGFYVSFFPQLVAGPIVRASEFVPQIHQPYKLTKEDWGTAIWLILSGLVKKIFLADFVALHLVDPVFSNPGLYTGFENLLALYGYSMQVYADFAGYTDIAIGVALLMGFRLPKNFNFPYKSRSVGEFWKRWHISLSTWLKDYLYIPLGGSRQASFLTWVSIPVYVVVLLYVVPEEYIWHAGITMGLFITAVGILSYIYPDYRKQTATNLNLMLTMVLGGLWHGASWQFVIWGALNGLGLVIYKIYIKHFPGKKQPGEKSNPLWVVFSVLLTFNFITFTRIWFRSESMEIANSMLRKVGSDFNPVRFGNFVKNFVQMPEIVWHYKWPLLVLLIGFTLHWLPDNFHDTMKATFVKSPIWFKVLAAILVVVSVYQVLASGLQPFIYFQF